jgi:hypothetical protein
VRSINGHHIGDYTSRNSRGASTTWGVSELADWAVYDLVTWTGYASQQSLMRMHEQPRSFLLRG